MIDSDSESLISIYNNLYLFGILINYAIKFRYNIHPLSEFLSEKLN